MKRIFVFSAVVMLILSCSTEDGCTIRGRVSRRHLRDRRQGAGRPVVSGGQIELFRSRNGRNGRDGRGRQVGNPADFLQRQGPVEGEGQQRQ